jgi:hypothetical protein
MRKEDYNTVAEKGYGFDFTYKVTLDHVLRAGGFGVAGKLDAGGLDAESNHAGIAESNHAGNVESNHADSVDAESNADNVDAGGPDERNERKKKKQLLILKLDIESGECEALRGLTVDFGSKVLAILIETMWISLECYQRLYTRLVASDFRQVFLKTVGDQFWVNTRFVSNEVLGELRRVAAEANHGEGLGDGYAAENGKMRVPVKNLAEENWVEKSVEGKSVEENAVENLGEEPALGAGEVENSDSETARADNSETPPVETNLTRKSYKEMGQQEEEMHRVFSEMLPQSTVGERVGERRKSGRQCSSDSTSISLSDEEIHQ